jgi:uncharacterized membrane protein
MDLMHVATGKQTYADVACHTMLGGYLGGLAAAAAGAADYFKIPKGSHTKRIANLHGALNLGMLGMYSLNLLLRRSKRSRMGSLALILSALGTAGLTVSTCYGGHMVYKHGMRVKGKSPIEEAPELKPPGDEKLAGVLKTTERAAPKDGFDT